MSYAVCVPYYSLPEFPSYCKIVRKRHLVLRDILLCNPSNFHVQAGIQYDPHFETLEYINCQPTVREGIARRIGKYKDIRILFRTRFLRLNGDSQSLVTGYYVIDSDCDEMCRDAPVIKASKAKFLSVVDCVNITSLLEKTMAYRSCFSTENHKWRLYLQRWIEHIDDRRDVTSDYVKEIQRLKRIYKENEFQSPGIFYEACQDCDDSNHDCPLIRRRMRYGPLPRFPGHFD